MTMLHVKPTETTPALTFDYQANRFSIEGESYPENVRDFYGDPIRELKSHLDGLKDQDVEFSLSFRYFHSSTARVLYGLFDALEECAAAGNTVNVIWQYEAEDENMEEMGEDLGDCLDRAHFKLCPKAEAK